MPSSSVISSLQIAALFVQPDGCYSGLPFVDAWPEERDARKYDGNLPVVHTKAPMVHYLTTALPQTRLPSPGRQISCGRARLFSICKLLALEKFHARIVARDGEINVRESQGQQ